MFDVAVMSVPPKSSQKSVGRKYQPQISAKQKNNIALGYSQVL